MRYLGKIAVLISMLLLLSCGRSLEVVPLPQLPGIGLSGLYSGEIDGSLFVAGGCNFPGKPVTEGGSKVFYSDIWRLSGGKWVPAGQLPAASAYGAYIATDSGLLIIGGANGNGSLDSVWMLSAGGVTGLQNLPKPLEQMAWCTDGNVIYLAGGLSCGVPSREIYRYKDGQWELAAMLPRPLVQCVACVSEGRLRVFGGYDPIAREAVTGGYAFSLEDGSVTTLQADMTFVGSAALDGFACGGCDAGIFTYALNLPSEKVREYQLQPVEYYKFRSQLLEYKADGWSVVAGHPAFGRAGAALSRYQGGLVIAGGELKPGIRTPEVWKIKTR